MPELQLCKLSIVVLHHYQDHSLIHSYRVKLHGSLPTNLYASWLSALGIFPCVNSSMPLEVDDSEQCPMGKARSHELCKVRMQTNIMNMLSYTCCS